MWPRSLLQTALQLISPLPALPPRPQDALAVAISLLDLQPTDLVLMSDLDEIPNASAIRLASNILWNGLHQGQETIPIVEFNLQCYYYSLWHMLVRPGSSAFRRPRS